MISIKLAKAIAEKAYPAFTAQPRSRGFNGADVYARREADEMRITIPHGAFTDGDDARSMTNLAKWIRQNAIARLPGRPAEMQDGRPRRLYIADADWDRLIALGDGNASKGIRIALDK